jgi:hypothetical protein
MDYTIIPIYSMGIGKVGIESKTGKEDPCRIIG